MRLRRDFLSAPPRGRHGGSAAFCRLRQGASELGAPVALCRMLLVAPPRSHGSLWLRRHQQHAAAPSRHQPLRAAATLRGGDRWPPPLHFALALRGCSLVLPAPYQGPLSLASAVASAPAISRPLGSRTHRRFFRFLKFFTKTSQRDPFHEKLKEIGKTETRTSRLHFVLSLLPLTRQEPCGLLDPPSALVGGIPPSDLRSPEPTHHPNWCFSISQCTSSTTYG